MSLCIFIPFCNQLNRGHTRESKNYKSERWSKDRFRKEMIVRTQGDESSSLHALEQLSPLVKTYFGQTLEMWMPQIENLFRCEFNWVFDSLYSYSLPYFALINGKIEGILLVGGIWVNVVVFVQASTSLIFASFIVAVIQVDCLISFCF